MQGYKRLDSSLRRYGSKDFRLEFKSQYNSYLNFALNWSLEFLDPRVSLDSSLIETLPIGASIDKEPGVN